MPPEDRAGTRGFSVGREGDLVTGRTLLVPGAENLAGGASITGMFDSKGSAL